MNQGEEKVQNALLFMTDLIGLIASYYIAGYLWLALWKNVSIPVYFSQMGDSLVSVVVSYMLAFLFYSKNNDFLQRGKFEELKAVVHLNVIMACIIAIYELLKRTNQQFPRGVYVLVVVFNVILAYIIRIIVKKSVLSRAKLGKSVNRVVAITTGDRVDGLNEIEKWNTTKQISGIIIVDRDMRGTEINGIPVVADVHDMIAYIKGGIVDEVYIDLNTARMEKITSLVMELEEMGVVVHLHLNTLENYKDFDMSLGKLGNIPVATFANRFYDYKELAFKRAIDIVGSLVGICIMLIAMIFVVPAIKLESKGPVFFKQKRVGKNGRYFYVYKFRSMYMDAEERKKELMKQNNIKDGMMFKMDDDPRIIKGVGHFIRKTSLDEFPQFWNILKGDMSLVGTRPPTMDEWEKYELHHRKRLAIKPGLTGMWQVSGRSDITDFEEVVELDTKYIAEWCLKLDIEILVKTVMVVFRGSGAK